MNQLPADLGGGGSTGGGQPDLASSPAEKKAAANTLHNEIEPHTTTAGAWADDETSAVVKAFDAKDGHGWVTSSAVSKAHKTWSEQVPQPPQPASSPSPALRPQTV
ncbi:hypothetical protein [Streptomyces sp. NPDC007905]|uniref:hypothetical protein n=1 Tax=Streptomyces sp. NPDC007905 TaxID=3364788 RepID=UPI0036E444E1